MAFRTAALILVAFAFSCALSADFLSTGRSDAQRQIQQLAMLEEIEAVFGPDHRRATELYLPEIAQALQTTFVSLPQTAGGAVSASSARYAIHRLFVQRHGWHVKGLAPMDGSWSTSPDLGMSELLPKRFVHLLTDKIAHAGFHHHEIAVLSATVEALIRGEVFGRLHGTYQALATSTKGGLSEAEGWQLIDTYMAFFMSGSNISDWPLAQIHHRRGEIMKNWAYWTHVHSLTREMQQKVAPDLQVFTFAHILKILEATHDRLGRQVDDWNCQDIEDKLLRIEERNGTGRVRLRDFYASYVNEGTWQFQERVDYLRQLGVLDESDPSVSRVIMPNYLNMQANCLNVSSLYDLCCIDACEDLLGHLESQIQAPHAAPGEIIRLVSALPSPNVPGHRTLSSTLVAKLHEVADHHGGEVPLHGRLFAQWMHFAYPRDCPYPHLAGSTRLLTNYMFEQETGMESSFTLEEMKSYLNSTLETAGAADSGEQEDDEGMCAVAMWVEEEQLVDAVHGKPPLPVWPVIRAALRVIAFLAVLLSSAVLLQSWARQLLPAIAKVDGGEQLLAKAAKLGFWGAKAENKKYSI